MFEQPMILASVVRYGEYLVWTLVPAPPRPITYPIITDVCLINVETGENVLGEVSLKGWGDEN